VRSWLALLSPGGTSSVCFSNHSVHIALHESQLRGGRLKLQALPDAPSMILHSEKKKKRNLMSLVCVREVNRGRRRPRKRGKLESARWHRTIAAGPACYEAALVAHEPLTPSVVGLHAAVIWSELIGSSRVGKQGSALSTAALAVEQQH
jgi:hypothetical protein